MVAGYFMGTYLNGVIWGDVGSWCIPWIDFHRSNSAMHRPDQVVNGQSMQKKQV